MKIAIVGTGAMGSLFAGRLAAVAEVVMVGSWTEQLRVVNSKGLRIKNGDGTESLTSFIATDDLTDIEPCDLVLIVVKSWQTRQAALRAKKLLSSSGLVLTLQNGLGNLEVLEEAVGKKRVVMGVTSEGATMLAPGVVRHAGSNTTFLAINHARLSFLTQIASLMNRVGFDTQLVDDAEGLMWGKLAINAGINALTALLGCRNGFLLENEATKSLMIQAAEETVTVANSQGITMPYKSASKRVMEVAGDTAENHSSMLQDINRGMPTEIEAINGAIVAIGRASQVDTPANLALLQLVNSLISKGEWRNELHNLNDAIQDRFTILASLEQLK